MLRFGRYFTVIAMAVVPMGMVQPRLAADQLPHEITAGAASQIDPNGLQALAGEEGPQIDPNGLRALRAGEEGPQIDPHGLRVVAGDAGPQIETNGARALFGDEGPQIDPNAEPRTWI